MPFYFRKSINAGPFHFNFSKGGVGVSIGVKGFRIGTGPRGHYAHVGRNGIYYRATINRAGEKTANTADHKLENLRPLIFEEGGVQMVEVESGDVQQMRPEKFSAILDEVNSKRQQQSLAILMALVLGGVGLFGGFAIGGVWPVMMLLALPGWMIGFWLDSYLRTVVLFYELEGEVEEVYKVLIASFDRLISCEAIWHVEAGGAVRDLTTWKRNAGASHIIKKKPTILTFKLPVLINCNITPPAAHVGRQVLYFLPDVVLIDDQGRIGAIDYSMLKIHWQDSNFIEDGSVPRDAEVIGHTWRYPNKSGGPDRRFNNNYQIPVCRYEVMHLKSDSGLNELIEFSKTGVVQTFASSVELLAQERAGSIKKSIGVNQPQSST